MRMSVASKSHVHTKMINVTAYTHTRTHSRTNIQPDHYAHSHVFMHTVCALCTLETCEFPKGNCGGQTLAVATGGTWNEATTRALGQLELAVQPEKYEFTNHPNNGYIVVNEPP